MINRITQKQIAHHMQVSVSTVSKALNDSHEISKELRVKIQDFAKKNQYVPNPTALNLKNKSTKTIALILPEIVHHFFSSVIKGIEQVAWERGYKLVISLSQDSLLKEVQNVQHLVNKNVDGFILSLSKETQSENKVQHLQEAIDLGIPIVLFDRISDAINCDKVISNDYESALNVTNKLLSEGRKNIGLITTQDYISVGTLRTKGYIDAIEKAGLKLNPKFILKISDVKNSKSEIQKFIKTTDLDGVIGVNEKFTASALAELKNKGKEIPTDVSLVTFSDGLLSTFTTPQLSALDQQGMEMGKESACLLINQLENISKKKEMLPAMTSVVNTKWIRRETTKF